MRWGLILFKGALVPVSVFAGGVLASNFLGALAQVDTGGSAALAVWSRHAVDVGFAGFILLYGAFLWRTWRWSEGAGPACQWCTGPLGHVRDGKVRFGKQLSDYRRCYNCGKPNACPE